MDTENVFGSILRHYELTEEDCAQQISDAHLADISESHCEHWRSLPAQLKIKTIVAKDIDRGAKEENEKRHAFFEKWKQERGCDATYKCLILGLLEIKDRESAESVCKLLKKSLTSRKLGNVKCHEGNPIRNFLLEYYSYCLL